MPAHEARVRDRVLKERRNLPGHNCRKAPNNAFHRGYDPGWVVKWHPLGMAYYDDDGRQESQKWRLQLALPAVPGMCPAMLEALAGHTVPLESPSEGGQIRAGQIAGGVGAQIIVHCTTVGALEAMPRPGPG